MAKTTKKVGVGGPKYRCYAKEYLEEHGGSGLDADGEPCGRVSEDPKAVNALTRLLEQVAAEAIETHALAEGKHVCAVLNRIEAGYEVERVDLSGEGTDIRWRARWVEGGVVSTTQVTADTPLAAFDTVLQVRASETGLAVPGVVSPARRP